MAKHIEGAPTHFLCTFENGGHGNYGPSSQWGVLDIFLQRALEMVAKRLGIPVESIIREVLEN